MAVTLENISVQPSSDHQPNSSSVNGKRASTTDSGKGEETATGATAAQNTANGVDGLTVVDTNSRPSANSPEGSNSTAAANLPPPEISKHIPCRYFPLGTCKYGSSCLFSHGVFGVAGSPGVPPSPSVQAQIPPQQSQTQQNQAHQQPQHAQYYPQQMQGGYMMQSDEYSQPIYYPVQQEEFAYAQQMAQFSPPPQGFYPFPPQFAYYPQQNVPQHYFQQMNPTHNQVAQAHSAQPVLDQTHSNSQSAKNSGPAQTEESAAESNTATEQTQSGNVSQATETTSPSSPAANLPSGASLHALFQNSSQPNSTAAQPNYVNGNAAAYPKANGRASQPIQRRPGSISGAGGLAQGGFGAKSVRRFPAGSVRPNCSFFEANRCRNRDGCTFPHILADGTDARSLLQGWMGADGRTEGPEERGGLPPIWLNNPLHRKHQNHPRNQFNPQQQQNQFNAAHFNPQQQQNSRPKTRFEHEQIRLPQPNGTAAPPNPSRDPNGSDGANNLVEAINGLTKNIPPATTKNSSAATGATAAQETGAAGETQRQRIPSGEDFPALQSAQESPVESRSNSPVTASEPNPEIPAATESTAAAPTEKTETAPNGSSSGNEDDFVIVQHKDAPKEAVENQSKPSNETAATTSPATPAPAASTAPAAAAPRPKISFASAAAKGAAVITPEPIRAKKNLVTPTSVNVGAGNAETKETNKKKTKNSSSGKPFEKKTSAAAQNVQPVAVRV